jgi:hypothetical protein
MPRSAPPSLRANQAVSSSRRDQTEDATLRSQSSELCARPPRHLQMQGTALLVQMMRKPGLQLTRTGRGPDPQYRSME